MDAVGEKVDPADFEDRLDDAIELEQVKDKK